MAAQKVLIDPKKTPPEQFELGELLGEGSYGSVWKGVHKKYGTEVAIKKVPFQEEKDMQEMMKEVSFMKDLVSPYIIRYYGSARYKQGSDDELWIVMEYCGAGSANDIMTIVDRPLSEGECSVICKYSLLGLEYLHSQRKIHRDIKAGNILLNDRGEGKLADFGVSGQISDQQAKRNTVIGTPFWMAPEVIQEVGYDYKADIWSLGITAIELAESRPPYANIHPMRAIFMIPSRPPPKLSEPGQWSSEFNDFVGKCLTKNPDERPTASQLLKHPFILKAKDDCVLKLLKENDDCIQKAGGRVAALGLDSEEESEYETDDEEEDEEDEEEESGGEVRGTNEDEEDYYDCGTGPIDVSGARGDGYSTMITPSSSSSSSSSSS
eukprot:CAMPEP_0201488026 /NCGR_PEP_ID=MMETSP0151_2-20130828/16492_1 /ASSEMBLY_ACC=CAM_ASM_000257 /TAXON_ID=200890 /ORGANISM="Paramoeba atlantica, Strain 621/1 / CCAP 1560/9" /LENGTH=379 /DNA_ID=CAMNT_0047873229 /DNA_START=176 /DNA_END=1312 /DNA_ORIENTATION=-